MISLIEIKTFKCFKLLKLPIKKFTLLSGTNASGKSSVLQSLVLLHQTIKNHEWSARLLLNGDDIKLGTVSDVVDKVNGRKKFEISIYDDEVNCHWTFSGEREEMSMAVESVEFDGVQHEKPKILHYLFPHLADQKEISLALRLRDLTYITAERVGPREFYSLEDDQVAMGVGPTGEHAVSVLYLGQDKLVHDELILEGVPGNLLRQVEARMAMFFPGCGLKVQQVAQTNAVTLGLRTSEDTDFHRPIHVGFGLTQVFPIIVAALAAKKKDILLIENPEVHLHPAGQVLMGKFLAEVANAGVQVIIETHSDHVLSGLRRAVKANKINPEDVAIHFFQSRSALAAQVTTPRIDASGNIDSWPEGFFDQFDKDASYFAGWGA